jgi:uncharacterized membrane protein YhaH (DUF805 family)
MASDMVIEDDTPGILWLLFSPSGRIGRQPFVMSMLLWLALLGIAIALMVKFEHQETGLILSALALVILSLGTFVSLLMLSIKRLHDMGFPAIFVLLLFIPVASLFALIAFLFWPSAPPNHFGKFTNRPK